MESENLKLQQSLTNAKSSLDYYKGLLDGAERKIEEINDGHKSELKNLQDELQKVKANAKTEGESHQNELTKQKNERETLQQGKEKELSDDYYLAFCCLSTKLPCR